MDVVNRAYSQLHDLYRSMTPGSRLMAGMFAAAVVAALSYLGTQQVARPESDLMHGALIAPSQLRLMEAAFGKAKLKGYAIRGSSIFVPRGQEAAYMAALDAANALPPSLGAPQRVAINGGSLLEGSGREQQRMRIAKLEGVANAIRSMPGIEDASVDYDVDNRPGPFKDKMATAVVWVKPAGAAQLDEATVLAIRDGVASAFAGLKPEDVAVSDLNGRTWRGAIGSAEENRYRSLKRASEQELKAKIVNVLSDIPNVAVDVNVELDREQAAGAKAAHPAAVHAVPPKDNQSNRPIASSQQPNVGAVLNALLSGTSGEGQAAPSDRPNRAAAETAKPAHVALTPISARVLVRVPMSYFKSVWRQRNPVEPGQAEKTPDQAALDQIRFEESANIQRCVLPLLPPAKDAASLAEMVTVTSFADVSAAAPTFGLREEVLNWATQSWKTLAGVGFALVCLLVLRSIVRGRPAEADEPAMTVVAEPIADATAAKPAKVAAPHWRRQPGLADRSIREELSELVEKDPETAANILRKWIGQVN